MKTNWIRRTLTTVSAVATFAALSFAQSGDVRGNVPFPFFAEGASLPAGDYEVTSVTGANGGRMYVIRNVETHKGALLSRLIPGEASLSSDTRPRVVFECAGETCWLKQLWTGSRTYQETRSLKSHTAAGATRVATVLLDARSGQ